MLVKIRARTHTHEAKNVRAWATLDKRGQIGPKGGQMGPQGADFLHAGIFLRDENIMFSKPGTQTNTSLAAQGALAHRLQRRPRPNHNNAKSGARPCLPPLGFNMAGGVK